MEKTQYLSTPCITLLVQTGSPEGKVGAKGDGGGEGTAIKPKSLAKKAKKKQTMQHITQFGFINYCAANFSNSIALKI